MEEAIMTVANDIFTPRYWKLQKAFPLRPIRNKKDAEAAKKVLFPIFRDHYDDPGEEAYVLALSGSLGIYEDEQEAKEPEPGGLSFLRSLVEENGMTQAQLAEVLKVSIPTVSQVLAGNRQITAEHARKLGKRFKLNPGVFL
jgi:HTH-type transcriptional regulator/antitoxin HigA